MAALSGPVPAAAASFQSPLWARVSRVHTESQVGTGGMAKGAGAVPGVGEEALKDEAHQWRPLAREGALCVSSAWGLHPDFPPHLLTLSQPGVPQGC